MLSVDLNIYRLEAKPLDLNINKNNYLILLSILTNT